jgi:hypothetical protein
MKKGMGSEIAENDTYCTHCTTISNAKFPSRMT